MQELPVLLSTRRSRACRSQGLLGGAKKEATDGVTGWTGPQVCPFGCPSCSGPQPHRGTLPASGGEESSTFSA